MRKKILSMLMLICMMILFAPTVLATELPATGLEKNVAEVDGVYYDELKNALKAVKSDSVVNILADITISDKWDARNTGGKITVPVTINGNGYTIKFTNVVKFLITYTVEDISRIIYHTFLIQYNSAFTLSRFIKKSCILFIIFITITKYNIFLFKPFPKLITTFHGFFF